MRRNRWIGGLALTLAVFGSSACSSDGDGGAGGAGGGPSGGSAGSDAALGGGGGSDAAVGGAAGSSAGGSAGTPSGGAAGTPAGGAAGAGGVGATGGGDTGGTGGFTGDACQAFCDKVAQVGCLGTQTKTECLADCALDTKKVPGCQAQAEAYLGCVATSGSITCASGQKLSGCQAEATALSVCAACWVDVDDPPCTICRKKNCCAELKAFGGASDVQPYSACVKTCSNASCLATCESKYPVAAAAFKKVDACTSAECPASCAKTGTGASDAVRSWCKSVLASSCSGGQTQSACEQGAVQDGKFYASADCGSAYWDALVCSAPKSIQCGDAGVDLDPSCQKPLEDCMNKTTSCPWSPKPDGSCEKLCYGWRAQCSPVDGSATMACSCTFGPHQGKTFQVTGTCPSSAVFDAMDAQCVP